MDRIVIAHWELSSKDAHSQSLYKDTPELESAIIEHGKRQLTSKGIEIFKQEKNVIVAENGCWGAFYESDLEKI